MGYTVSELARLSGVSARTLRYYDGIGLLCPDRDEGNGYRLYGETQVDRLQQILFYRELGVELAEIKRLLADAELDRETVMLEHLAALKNDRSRLDALIKNVERTIKAMNGEDHMTDKEKFEGFKKELVEKNERDYGAEARKKYGDGAVDASNEKVMGMSKADYDKAEALRLEINKLLKKAVAEGDPAGEAAQLACEKHKQWLCMHWGEGKYSKQAHLGLAEMYVADPRFAEYYAEAADGAAQFLRDALAVYCK